MDSKRGASKRIQDNWKDAFAETGERTLPCASNIIGSHVVKKCNIGEDGIKRMTECIFRHGNCDRGNEDVIEDSANARFVTARIILSMYTLPGLRIGASCFMIGLLSSLDDMRASTDGVSQ